MSGPRSVQPFDRAAGAHRLRTETFDVLVIGGGITGLGVALDAASRGLRTALVERRDFASGTSSKSSKLVHGGLRYLQQGDVRLVYEALHERQRLRRNARHLVDVLPFMIPILTKDGLISRKVARALGSALWMYDLTGGLRIGKIHRRLTKTKALSHLPTIDPDRLASAYVYYDAQADDARLCLALARSAWDAGAAVSNYCEVVRVEGGPPSEFSVTLRDEQGTFAARARSIVNATGVWVDSVVASVTRPFDGDAPSQSTPASSTLRPAKGVHVTVPWDKVRNDIAVVIPVPKDRRSLFLVPWGRRPDGTFTHTYVGTTDTDYHGPLDDPQCSKDDVEYILRALGNALTTEFSLDDITGTWAGLRPLVVPNESDSTSRTADLSRRHRVSSEYPGFVTITGGKLTTYRKMAEDAVDAVLPVLGLSHRRYRCRTKRLRLHGAGSMGTTSRQIPIANHLWKRYGSDAHLVAQMMLDDPDLSLPLVAGLAYVRAEVVYAVRHEMALTVADVLERRTRALLFDRDAARDAAEPTARLMGSFLGWTASRIDDEIRSFHEICSREDDSINSTESSPAR